ncbi:MAG: hypothetical protein PGN13_14460 [Patulibacter minatonensis]
MIGKGREHDRDGAAQTGPPEHDPLDEREVQPAEHDHRRQRAGDDGGEDREERSGERHLGQAAREDQQAEGEEEAELGDPREALVERLDRALRGNLVGGERDAAEEDRQEAGAVEGVGTAERERGDRERGDGVQAGRAEFGAPQEPGAEEADRDADGCADEQLLEEEQRDVLRAGAGFGDELDQRDREQHRDRVVEARLALEGVGEAPADRGAAHDREHGRAVGPGDDRAEQQALEQREVEEPPGGESGDRGG